MHTTVERRVPVERQQGNLRAREPAAQSDRPGQLARAVDEVRNAKGGILEQRVLRRPPVLEDLTAERLEAFAQSGEAAADVQQNAAHRSSSAAACVTSATLIACMQRGLPHSSVERWQRRTQVISRLNRRF